MSKLFRNLFYNVIRGFIKDILYCGGQFLVIAILFGRLPVFLEGYSRAKGLLKLFSSTKLLFGEKLLQYLNFISSCFIIPKSVISTGDPIVTYHLAPITSLNLIGLILLCLTGIAIGLNYRDKFVKILIGWVAISFILLCLIGWGTAENGLVLYTLYFNWAFLGLLFPVIEKLFAKIGWGKYMIYTAIILVLGFLNIKGIIGIIDFGIKYYPLLR